MTAAKHKGDLVAAFSLMTKPAAQALRRRWPPEGARRKGTKFGHVTPEVNSGYALFRKFVDKVNKHKGDLAAALIFFKSQNSA